MESLIPENEYKEVDGRVYANPQIGIDESNTFIDNLRSTQDQQNEQITTDTRMLGTDVPTNLGGLTGADSYFTSRYQTPQTVANVNNLRATAQAAALNQVLENEQAIWKKKYQDAYRKYQKRQYDKANTPSSTGGGGKNDGDGDGDGDINQNNTTAEIGSVNTEALAQSRYTKLLMKYIEAGYPVKEAESRAKEDFGKSISVDAPVEPYNGGN